MTDSPWASPTRYGVGPASSETLRSTNKVKFTGLTQHSQVDPAVKLKIPIRALELTQILGQPCKFQVTNRTGLEPNVRPSRGS
jgi:hypothetical protein